MEEKNLKHILQQDYNFEKNWKSILTLLFGKIDYFLTPSNPFFEQEKVKSGKQIGAIKLDDNKSLAIFEVEVDDSIRIDQNRKGLRDIAAKHIDQNITHGALVFFFSKNQKDYRFSFIAKWSDIDLETSEFIKGETKPKRFTYLLGGNESCTTAAKRLLELAEKKDSGALIGIKQLLDTFSVEPLKKDFFKSYKEHYEKFWRYIANPEFGYREILLDTSKDEPDKQEKPIRDFAKKLLGRIVFLHFLQKKGWMGCPANTKQWEDGKKQFLQLLFGSFGNKEAFHSQCLTKLFFNTLNTKRKNDTFEIEGLNGGLSGSRVPYLNGGLFDADKPKETLTIDFPVSYFEELFEFFAQYNFTIDENSPDDHEVGIDPEMLGHIFENLLEENREKGAFYTPKEVVQYMCKESLILYLKNHFPEEANIESIIRHSLVSEYLGERDNATSLNQKLDTVKICDPAIGSGAFPIGILHEIFEVKKFIYPYLKTNKEFSPAKVKKAIIQNSIYGVDIEKGAVDIAQLRFWLALVVDETVPEPLPNLDYKIMQGNSLLESFEGIDLSKVANEDLKIIEPERDLFGNIKESQIHLTFTQSGLVDEIQKLIGKYFNIESATNKKEIRQRVNELVNQHILYNLELKENQLKRWLTEAGEPGKLKNAARKKYNLWEREFGDFDRKRETLLIVQQTNEHPYFLWHLFFMDVFDQGGFDIVIGNPPYQRIQGIRKEDPKFADQLVELYDSATGSFDLYVTFVEKGLNLCKDDGVLNFIMPVKWTNSAFGKGLRKVMTENNAVNRIISFGAYQVFNASTYTGLQWFKRDSKNLLYAELDRDLLNKDALRTYLDSQSIESYNQFLIDDLKIEAWTLVDSETKKILEKIEIHSRNVNDLFEKIFQGIATSKDSVYFLFDCIDEGENIVGFSKELDRNIKVEKGLVKPLLKGDDVHRYSNIQTNKYVIFPYKFVNEGKKETVVLYTENELMNLFPSGYSYLKECEEILRNRENGRLKGDQYWFRYIYPKNQLHFKKEKLIAPDISMGGNFSLDEDGIFYSTTTLYGYVKRINTKESYKFLIALMNSKVLWWYLVNTGTVLANGYFRFKPDYIKPFPIPELKNAQQEKSFINLVDFVFFLKNKNTQQISQSVDNDHIALFFEDIIDGCVFELYFEQHMKEKGINILDMVTEQVQSIEGKVEKKDGEVILNTWIKMRKSEISERMRSFTVKSSDILKPIIQS
jgi:Eco57I restriction-modification methylase/restriction endonuclease TaqI-like protein